MNEQRGRGRGTNTDRLNALDRRLAEARKPEAKPSTGKEKYAAMSMGWRMTMELILGVMVGAAMGWGLDTLLGTLPLLLIVFVGLGFASGVRTMMRSAAEMQRRQAAEAAEKDEG